MAGDSEDEGKKEGLKGLIKRSGSTIITGVLIAWAGLVGNWVLQTAETRRENARLLTELQVRREEVESNMRQGIFAQTIEKLLASNGSNEGDYKSLSRQIMHLELLALNFGDSLSLSPIFSEYNRILNAMKTNGELDSIIHVEDFKKRLRGLARRVADGQLESLSNRGAVKTVKIELTQHTPTARCEYVYFSEGNFTWPVDLSEYSLEVDDESTTAFAEANIIEFDGVRRELSIIVNNVNLCDESMNVRIELRTCSTENSNESEPCAFHDKWEDNHYVEQKFKLDYFNFPKVDNTRLKHNHRFALVPTETRNENYQYIELDAVIFPSDYASLRDRPGMNESLQMLRSALNDVPDE